MQPRQFDGELWQVSEKENKFTTAMHPVQETSDRGLDAALTGTPEWAANGRNGDNFFYYRRDLFGDCFSLSVANLILAEDQRKSSVDE